MSRIVRKPVLVVSDQVQHNYRKWLDALNFGFRKKMHCSISVSKTKALISCAVTVQLICTFVFAYANSRFPHARGRPDIVHFISNYWVLIKRADTKKMMLFYHH